jgi:hypothetical protein
VSIDEWYARYTYGLLDGLARSGLRADDQLAVLRLRLQASQRMSDGYLASPDVDRALARRLIAAGWLSAASGGYMLARYHETEPTAARVREQREQWRARQRRRRQRAAGVSGGEMDADDDADVDRVDRVDQQEGVTCESPRDVTPDVTRESHDHQVQVEVQGDVQGAEERSHKSTAGRVSPVRSCATRRLPEATHEHACAYVKAERLKDPAISAEDLWQGICSLYTIDTMDFAKALEADAYVDPWSGPPVTDRLPPTAPRTVLPSTGNPFDEVIGPDPATAEATESERIRGAKVFRDLIADHERGL